MPLISEIPLAERLAQFWLFGVAIIGLWGGLFYIAFTSGETNGRFLLLGCGGLATAAAFIWVIEQQRRRHGELALMHDYILGMSLFFAAAGVFWGLRWLIGFAADPAGPLDFDWLVDEDRPYTEEGWSPGAMGIVVQASAAVILAIFSWWYLKVKETGVGILSWFVASLTPFALLIVGLGTWLDWTNGSISYEMGVSMIILCMVGMWLAVQSNRALVFSVVAVLASFMPIIYEIGNDGSGSALSLMVFIIFAQGFLAISPQLAKAQRLIEMASLGVVIAALVAMAWMTGDGLTMHLGPVKLPADHWISGASVIWFSLLIGYLGAMHMKRVPWMPVGLAFALFMIPSPSNQLTWALTLAIIPYLLWKPDTRTWVRNSTYICATFAFLVADWMSAAERHGAGEFWGSIEAPLIHIIPVALLAIGEGARRANRIGGNSFRAGMALIVFSPSMLIEANSAIPWAFAGYLLLVTWEALRKPSGTIEQRKEASMTVLTSLGLTSMLALMDRLEVPESIPLDFQGFNIILAIIATTYYVLGMKGKASELDLGHFTNMAVKTGAPLPVFDPSSGLLQVAMEKKKQDVPDWLDKGWGEIARVSLIGPLFLLGIAIAGVNTSSLVEGYWALTLAIPAGILMNELIRLEENTAQARAMAVWAMIVISLPTAVQLNEFRGPGLQTSQLIFDAILLAGPVSLQFLYQSGRIGKELHSRNADLWTLIGLLCLGLLDSSGGLAFIPLFTLVAWRTWYHRLRPMSYALPLALIMSGTSLSRGDGILMSILDGTALEELLLSEGWFLFFPMARILGFIGAIAAMAILGRIIRDRRHPPEDEERFPFLWSAMFLLFSVQAAMTQDEHLLLVMTTIIVFLGWMAGRLEVFTFAPWAYLVSFTISISAIYPEMMDIEAISWAFLLSGIMTMLFSLLAREGILYRFADDVGEDKDGPVNVLELDTLASRDFFQRYLYWSGLLLLFLSFDIFHGLSTVLAATWVTYDVYRRKEKEILLYTPILHAFALTNVGRFFPDLMIDNLGGWVLAGAGLLFTYLSWKKWYPDWGWEEDGADYWKWNDRMGMLGVAYFGVGIWWALFDASGLLVALIIILYGGAMVSIDPDTAWRRVMGILASTFGGFIALVDDQDQTLSGIVMIIAGLAAFIQAAMYFQRWGVGFREITEEEPEPEEAVIMAVPATTDEILEAEDVEDEEPDLPAPVLKEEDLEDIADEPVEEVSEEEDSEVAPTLDMSRMSTECTARVLDISNGIIDTGRGMKIRINEDMAAKLRTALLNTEFEGFIPKVGFDNLGRAVLSFDPDPNAS